MSPLLLVSITLHSAVFSVFETPTRVPDFPFSKDNHHNDGKYHGKEFKTSTAKLSPAVDADIRVALDSGAAVRPLI